MIPLCSITDDRSDTELANERQERMQLTQQCPLSKRRDGSLTLIRARQETRYIDERDDGDVEGIAEADPASCLDTGVDV